MGSLIMSEWYAGGIEHSPYPPPMLESEKTVEKRVTDYGNMCALSGFIFSSLYMYNRCGAVKARFAAMGLKGWQLGSISVVAASTLGAKTAHYRLFSPQLYADHLPDGYYRQVHCHQLEISSVEAKRDYFEQHQAELKSRYRAIGVNWTSPASGAPSTEQGEPATGWRSWEAVRAEDEVKSKK